MKLVAAIKMLPSREQAASLKATLVRCNEACTWLAATGFEKNVLRQYDLHKLAYSEMRQRFGLTAQAAVRSIAKVADAFKINRSIAPAFRKDAAQPYDDRIIRFVKDGTAVNLWTVEGRITVPVVMGEHQQRLMAYRKGEVDLCFVRGKWMLAATCDIPETEEFKAADWLGVDFGIVSLAVDSDGTKHTGADVERPRGDVAGWAWLAGLLDGEGYFGIRNRTARDGEPRWFRAVITVGMTSETACRKALEVSNCGSVRLLPRQTTTGKPIWEWQVTTRDALIVAENVLPYLAEKTQQARLILSLKDIIDKRPVGTNVRLSQAEVAERLNIKNALQRLNLRAKAVVTPPQVLAA